MAREAVTTDLRLLELVRLIERVPAPGLDRKVAAASIDLGPRQLDRLCIGTTESMHRETFSVFERRMRYAIAQRSIFDGTGLTQALRRSGFGSRRAMDDAFRDFLGMTPSGYLRFVENLRAAKASIFQ